MFEKLREQQRIESDIKSLSSFNLIMSHEVSYEEQLNNILDDHDLEIVQSSVFLVF